jgi:predicted PolB exonuclease-like 3'-5' exonuclease
MSMYIQRDCGGRHNDLCTGGWSASTVDKLNNFCTDYLKNKCLILIGSHKAYFSVKAITGKQECYTETVKE